MCHYRWRNTFFPSHQQHLQDMETSTYTESWRFRLVVKRQLYTPHPETTQWISSGEQVSFSHFNIGPKQLQNAHFSLTNFEVTSNTAIWCVFGSKKQKNFYSNHFEIWLEYHLNLYMIQNVFHHIQRRHPVTYNVGIVLVLLHHSWTTGHLSVCHYPAYAAWRQNPGSNTC